MRIAMNAPTASPPRAASSKYVDEVRRWGGVKPFHDENDQRRNLRHDHAPIAWSHVFTDGHGHVADMPLLERKGCYGRPERRLRGEWEQKPAVMIGGEWRRPPTICQRCKLDNPLTSESCEKLSLERISSSAEISEAVADWLDETDGLVGHFKFRPGRPATLWQAVLRAIIAHGGWSNVNDARAAAAAARRHEDRNKKRRDGSKEKRRQKSLRRYGKVKPITPEFLFAVEAERDRRLEILEDLAGIKNAPRFVTRLSMKGRKRIADVWMAQTILLRHGSEPSGRGIAEFLVADQRAVGAELESLRTEVYRVKSRIQKLESTISGKPVWEPFVWKG